MDLLGNARIFHGMWMDGAQIVDFVLSLEMQCPTEEDWETLLRIDCCHNEVHSHWFGEGEVRKVIRGIKSPKDVVDGLAEAEILIYDDWEENVRRWSHGR